MSVFEGLSPPYSTIVADPPWPYDGIAALPVADLVGSRGGFLFLWTTNRYLPDAFRVAEAWGFAYRQTLVWHKGDASPFPAAVAPNSAEFLLVCRSGSRRRLGTWPTSVVHANRGPHSAKPAAFGDLVERVSPGPYLELFARQPRLGWDAWGRGYELGGRGVNPARVTPDPAPWMDQAACTGVSPDVFFPERGKHDDAAKAICRGCPVRAECLEYAMANREIYGVWGGLSERERRRLRAYRRRVAS